MSTLKVNTIQDTTGNDALTIDSSGNVTASQGFVPSTQLSHRNLIINGAMQVAQRGTSFTTNGYTLDRWDLSLSGATGTVTQESFALDSEVGGCKNYQKLAVTTGDNFCGIVHRIEDVQSIKGGETFTLSFYAKGTNPGGGSMKVRVRQRFGSGGSTAVNVGTLDSITLTNSWQRFTITKTYNSLSGKTIGTGSFIELFIHQDESDTSTDAWELNITGVQLEVGSVATPFEHRSYGEELARCQRYYVRYSSDGSNNQAFLIGAVNSSTSAAICSTNFTNPMRAIPTASYSGADTLRIFDGSGAPVLTSISTQASSITTGSLDLVASGGGLTTGRVALIIPKSNTDCYVDFDAEL